MVQPEAGSQAVQLAEHLPWNTPKPCNLMCASIHAEHDQNMVRLLGGFCRNPPALGTP